MDRTKLADLAEAVAEAQATVEDYKKKADDFRQKHADSLLKLQIAKDNLEKFLGLK